MLHSLVLPRLDNACIPVLGRRIPSLSSRSGPRVWQRAGGSLDCKNR